MTITLQALLLEEKMEPVQVHFTLHLRDQRSVWMQDGCEVYMDSYMASNGSMQGLQLKVNQIKGTCYIEIRLRAKIMAPC